MEINYRTPIGYNYDDRDCNDVIVMITMTTRRIIKINDFLSVITVFVMAIISCVEHWINQNVFTCLRLSTRSLLRVNKSPRG